MSILKQIQFGSAVNPIAQTKIQIVSSDNNVLTLSSEHTELTDSNDPVYTLGINVDGTTLMKDTNGIKSALKLLYVGAKDGEKSHIALAGSDGAEIQGTKIEVEDIVGNGMLQTEGTEYDAAKGKLILNFATSDNKGKKVEIDLGKILDIDDVIISEDSSSYLKVEQQSGAEDKSNFKIGVKKATISSSDGDITVNTSEGSILDPTEAVTAIKTFVNSKTEGIEVTAQGDDYISATQDSSDKKKINVTTNVADFTIDKQSDSDTTLTGTANKLAKSDDTASKVSQFVNTRITEEVAKLDAVVRGNLTELDAVEESKHIGVKVEQVDGKITGVTVVESGLASSEGLDAETSRSKSAETAIDSAIGLTKGASDETRTYSNEGSYIGKESSNTIKSDIKALDTQLKTVSDATSAIKYKINGTTLELFGFTEKVD